jgi:hypothetical protein
LEWANQVLGGDTQQERKFYIQESFGNEEDKNEEVQPRVEFDTRQTEEEDLEEVIICLRVVRFLSFDTG